MAASLPAGLPARIDPASIRASGSGAADNSIINVDVKRALEPLALSEDLRRELDEADGPAARLTRRAALRLPPPAPARAA